MNYQEPQTLGEWFYLFLQREEERKMRKNRKSWFRRMLEKLRRRNPNTMTGCRPKQRPVKRF